MTLTRTYRFEKSDIAFMENLFGLRMESMASVFLLTDVGIVSDTVLQVFELSCRLDTQYTYTYTELE